ncbi:TPT-domain-containing protein [Trichodelitschia bisporula]|uniref:TPT-domain-containing protein n=1 Tax=Trichodelitschia bisporula TaxID=703511 RepID=A0A6G1HM97_9PEZI|nr:TPT-domain-containing protein [Trichodelitschia bisporula]
MQPDMDDSSSSANGMSTFPSLSPDGLPAHYEESSFRRSTSSPSKDLPSGTNGTIGSDRWRPRASSKSQWGGTPAYPSGARHGRQKSLSEAIRTIRTRSGSVSQNAHELADALKAPVSPKLVMLCVMWYLFSMLANTSAGEILDTHHLPITLTVIQFAFVCFHCIFLGWLASRFPFLKEQIPALRNGIRRPDRDIIRTTLPLTGFMIGGHILTSDAMSRIPVSMVHTIKGLSPLFTVMAYRLIFRVHYSPETYLSLVPLTAGVMMACSTHFSSNFLGLASAFASAILFVTQNIMSKKLFNEAAIAEQEGPQRTRKPDKLNLLCYSSGLALIFTSPLWLWSEGFAVINTFLNEASIDAAGNHISHHHGRLFAGYFFNGTFHFAQSLVAFTLLSLVSPVTYSVASLLKRVFVIVCSILWFGNKVSGIQGVGICLTFLGLYLYDRTNDAAKTERRAKHLQLPSLLPLHEKAMESPSIDILANGQLRGEKRSDSDGWPEAMSNGWLPPGTKAEHTWTSRDMMNQPVPVS